MESDDPHDAAVCSHCGAELAPRASFCRACGASEDSGWSEGAYESTEEWALEDESDFDYDDFVAREFPDAAPGADQLKWVLLAVAALGVTFALLGRMMLGR